MTAPTADLLGPARRAGLAANLQAVRQRLADACASAGRAAGDVRLVAVTKTFPATDVRLLRELGVRDVAENRAQELLAKHEELRGDGADLRWHFVGQLQTNKAARVARVADVVQSVDRPALVAALDRAAAAAGRTLEVLVQVNLDPPTGAADRGGVAPAGLDALADAVAGAAALRLVGVMAVAPPGLPARPAFARLRELSDALTRRHPRAREISAGMSADLEDAVAEGATFVRVGTALLGRRDGPLG